ncbi:hypothetical protein INR49_011509 [Caranx melampygus]|nr:hypothetical protein INR49_011509 [Caranx melampygus]
MGNWIQRPKADVGKQKDGSWDRHHRADKERDPEPRPCTAGCASQQREVEDDPEPNITSDGPSEPDWREQSYELAVNF